MSPEFKKHIEQNISIESVKQFLNSANLDELRIIDIAVKERKHEIISNGLEPIKPSIRLSVSVISGHEYIYIHAVENGKKVTRKIKENDLSQFNFETAKISPKAKKVLSEKYKLAIP